MNRREWLKINTAAAAWLALPLHANAGTRSISRIGVQLYTVRDLMAKDVHATLAAVAAAGYAEVETAGTGNLDASQFSRALKDEGLVAPSAHIPFNLMAEQPETVLESAQTIGYRHLVLPWIPPEMRTAEGYGQVIDVLNGFGERCANVGMRVGYHNHDFEFERIGDTQAYDLLLRECDPKLVCFELDLYWAAHAGADAATILRSAPERFPLCHVKDRTASGEMVDVGAGIIDFGSLFSAGSGLQHYFVEHDRPADSLRSIRNSIAALQKVRF